MTLSDLSIHRPVFAWMLMFGLIFFGVLSFLQMGINENPDVEYPTIRIRYGYDGATAAVIEKDVLEPVESVLVTMDGIRSLQASAERGEGDLTLEFSLNRDIDFALQEVNTLLSRAQRLLPDTIDPPVVTKSNAADDPIMYLALRTEDLSTRELNLLFKERIRDRISTVEGVAEVRAFGFHEPMLRIDLKADKLKQYQLTATDVVESIRREHQELPAGRFEYREQEEQIRIMGEATEPEEFANMVISRRGGAPNFQPQRIRDVANVYEGVENIRRVSRVDGIPALAMAIQKQRGVNAVSTADRVKERIESINLDLPKGTKLLVNFDRTQFVRQSVNELLFTLILSAILTSIVCWIFIGSFSAAVNILLAIPTAIIGTFIFINWLGFTLNSFTLLALALAIGVVVDDAIVMLENIIRFVQKGYGRVNAAFKGAREISFAVIATTVALVSIFVPILFLPGLEGRFFFEFAVTIAIALVLSSIEALTLAPMRCSQFLKLGERRFILGKIFDSTLVKITRIYSSALNFMMGHRWKLTFSSLLLFAGSLTVLKFLPLELVPYQDRGSLFVILIAPEGKSIEYTVKKAKEFEDIVRAHPDVERVFVAAGGFGRGGQGNRGNGVVILKDQAERTQSQFEIADDLRASLKSIDGIRIFLRDRTGSPLAGRRGSPVEFTINGPDPEMSLKYYEALKLKMEEDPELVGIRSDDAEKLPEIHLIPNREKALQRGVEIQEIAETINATYGGLAAVQYTDGSSRSDAFVQLQPEDRQKAEDIDQLLIRNNRGELITLSEVVDTVKVEGPQEIYREDRIRGIRVDADLATGAALGDAIIRIQSWADDILPADYFIRFSDTPQDKLLQNLAFMLLGLIFAYMILGAQFNSFLDPLLIYLAIPFAVSGSLIALLLGGQSLNIYSVIGILLTMGIVKKNSILLIEFTNQLRDRGLNIAEALKEACQTRLRPILMTNTATLAAALPAALAMGPGSEIRVPMALTVIGGVSLSAFFTLFVVPVVYSLVAPKRNRVFEESDPDIASSSAG